MVGQPRLLSGQLHVVDLLGTADRVRVMEGLHPGGPLNTKLAITSNDHDDEEEATFMAIRDGGKTLVQVTMREDEDMKQVFTIH